MPALADGFGGYGTLLLVGFLVTEPWRWLGLVIGRGLDVEGQLFLWVRAVASALVAGLITRLLIYPTGALADVPLAARGAAFAAGLAVFLLAGRNLGLGVLAGVGAVIMAKLAVGSGQ